MRRCFNIWKEKILSEIQKHQKNQEKIKQLERFINYYFVYNLLIEKSIHILFF